MIWLKLLVMVLIIWAIYEVLYRLIDWLTDEGNNKDINGRHDW